MHARISSATEGGGEQLGVIEVHPAGAVVLKVALVTLVARRLRLLDSKFLVLLFFPDFEILGQPEFLFQEIFVLTFFHGLEKITKYVQ